MLPSGAPLSAWLTWLESLSPNEIDLGLERVREVLERLEVPVAEHVIIVAGTNGKGSSVAMMSALLRAAGKRVGAYTSPHMIDYNERIVVQGQPASDDEIVAAFEKIEAVRKGVPLTYFEYGTLAAFVVFAEAALDVWVLEVGMGGRLDATNVVEPTAALITTVSLDHCDWLGHDVETIAIEKAGVMRTDIPTVFGDVDIPESILRRAAECRANLFCAGQDFDLHLSERGAWSWRGPTRAIEDLARPGLHGDFQIRNAAAVLMLLESAGLASNIDAALINKVLPGLSLAGRLQRMQISGLCSTKNEWLIDVAHNPAAANALASALEAGIG